MSTRQIAGSTLWQIGSQMAMAALSIVTVKCVAMGLSTELAGTYNTAYGFLQIFGILADFGLYAVAVRELSKVTGQERERVLGSLLVLRLIILLLSLATALVVAWVIPAWQGSPLPIAISVAAFVPFFTLLAGMLRTVFQVHYKMQFVFIAEVSQRILALSIIAVPLILGLRQSADENYLLLFLLAGGLGAALLLLISIFAAVRFMTIRPHWDGPMLLRLLGQAAPYGIAYLCTTLYRQTDVTLIGLLRSDYAIQNAMYGFVQRALDMGYLFPTFLLNSTLPMISELRAKGKDSAPLLGKTLFAIVLLCGTIFLFAFLWSRPLMRLLTTEDYLSTAATPGSDTALHLLSLPMFMNGLILFSFYTLLAAHRWKPLVSVLAGGALLSVIVNLTLIPTLGFVGASYTSMIVHTALAVVLLPFALRTLRCTIDAQTILRGVGYLAIVALILYTLSPMLTNDIATAICLTIAGILLLITAELTGIRRLLIA